MENSFPHASKGGLGPHRDKRDFETEVRGRARGCGGGKGVCSWGIFFFFFFFFFGMGVPRGGREKGEKIRGVCSGNLDVDGTSFLWGSLQVRGLRGVEIGSFSCGAGLQGWVGGGGIFFNDRFFGGPGRFGGAGGWRKEKKSLLALFWVL